MPSTSALSFSEVSMIDWRCFNLRYRTLRDTIGLGSRITRFSTTVSNSQPLVARVADRELNVGCWWRQQEEHASVAQGHMHAPVECRFRRLGAGDSANANRTRTLTHTCRARREANRRVLWASVALSTRVDWNTTLDWWHSALVPRVSSARRKRQPRTNRHTRRNTVQMR